jgi:capsular polysaccharide biosynthesis protein
MNEMDIELCDAELASSQYIERIVLESSQIYRRWRPALIRGAYENEFVRKYFDSPASIGPSGYLICKNSTIIIDGLVICDSKLLTGRSMMYPVQVFPYDIHSEYFRCSHGEYKARLPERNVYFEGRTAVIASPGWRTYGHWIVDLLPRYFRSLEANPDRFLFPGPAQQWQSDMLRSYGIDSERCEFVDLAETKVTCEEAVVPMFDRFNSEIRPIVVDCHQGTLIDNQQSSEEIKTRIFVSRSGNSARKLRNRSEIEKIAELSGFEIVRPETMQFPRQVTLFSNAEIIAGECGSGLHSAVYSPPGTKICVLQSEKNHNFLQSQIAMHKRQDIAYVIGVEEEDHSGDYTVSQQEFAVALKAIS